MDDASCFVSIIPNFNSKYNNAYKNIYDEGELNELRTCKCDLQVQIEGNRKANKGT